MDPDAVGAGAMVFVGLCDRVEDSLAEAVCVVPLVPVWFLVCEVVWVEGMDLVAIMVEVRFNINVSD